jgi:ATP-dependent RNA helicase RhlE
MLDMGFIAPVRAIAAAIGPARQTALFSATMAPEVAKLAAGLLTDPVRVEAAAPATTLPAITQEVLYVPTAAKRQQLNQLLKDASLEKIIVFSRTKHGADRVTKNLGLDGHEAAAIHGNKSQNARQAALKGFSTGAVRILVATDIAARGIDVPGITHVINYELPDDPENYVHRIGRTGRNGATGVAITLCDGAERGKLRDIERLIRRTLPRGDIVGQPEIADAASPPATAPGREPSRRPPRHQSAAHNGRPANPSERPASQPSRPQPAASARSAPGDSAKNWWEYPTGARPDAPARKQRWSKARKATPRSRRPAEAGNRRAP